MNNLDLIILIPIALGFVFGLFKGLIKELASLAAIFLGVYGAKVFAPSVSVFFIHTFSFSPKTALPITYLFIFILIAALLLILARMLDNIFNSIALGGLNKLLGGIFAALKYALVVSVLLNVFDALDSRFPIIKQKSKSESIGYKPFMKLAPTLWDEGKKDKIFGIKNNSSLNEKETKSNR